MARVLTGLQPHLEHLDVALQVGREEFVLHPVFWKVTTLRSDRLTRGEVVSSDWKK